MERMGGQGQRHETGPTGVAPGSFGEYDSRGVDVSLLRWMLRLSPLERLVKMEQHAQETQILLAYGRRHREAQAARPR